MKISNWTGATNKIIHIVEKLILDVFLQCELCRITCLNINFRQISFTF